MIRLALDVSNVNPATREIVHASQCELLIAKATEGVNYDDAYLAGHRKIARELEIGFGSYIFLHALEKGNEAHHYLDYAKPAADEITIIDAEWAGLDGATIPDMARRVNSCAHALEAEGRHPILYTSQAFWVPMIQHDPNLKRLRIWEANYPLGGLTHLIPDVTRYRLQLRYGAHVSMWQWTDRYQVLGRRFDMSLLFEPVSKLRQPLHRTVSRHTSAGGGARAV